MSDGPPNMRVQRTRSASLRSPLTRGPLGSFCAPSTVSRAYGGSPVERGDARASSQSEVGRTQMSCENPFLEKVLPNMRMQRTRSARFARGSSPLMRRPLGGPNR